jgi:hypothetical protein
MAPHPVLDPPEKRPRALADLEFERKPMVRWLSPRVLVEAGLRVVVSSLFGQYADKREFQAVLDPAPGPPLTYGAADEEKGAADEEKAFWLDFVADLGDGFDSTYAMACLLARQRLELAGVDGAEENPLVPEDGLPRGRALIMGGDEVYPVATREEYENRFRWPYTAAFPTSAGPAPDLLAIPGNHDWYDGLTNFLRFFCAGREIGAWQTKQRRSYFALRLPGDWWLLAIDIQLDTYIDEPQLAYFQGIGLGEGDQVILVTGKPSWVKVGADNVPDSYKNIEYFEEKVVKKAGAEVRVTLTGDLHHYCRYQATDRDHNFITSGGGGAYLFPTHTMPQTLELPEGKYEQESCYPEKETSEALTKGARWLFRLAPGLCATIAALYAGFAASLFAAIEIGPGWYVASVMVGVVMLLSLVTYSAAETTLGKWGLGALHSFVHLLAAAASAIAIAVLADANWLVVAVAALGALIGYFAGGSIFGEYLILSHRHAPKHANEVLACQGVPDYKNFLRLRLDERGLTIYPIGVDRVPRQWEPDPDGAAHEPWLRPEKGDSLKAHLIEPPLHFPTQ